MVKIPDVGTLQSQAISFQNFMRYICCNVQRQITSTDSHHIYNKGGKIKVIVDFPIKVMELLIKNYFST
jgi:hypothetical protein